MPVQSLDSFPSKACPFSAKGHALWSPSNLLLLFVGMLSDLLGEKDVFDQLGGLAVQTISVPVHAVDLLCDPQSIAYTCNMLHFSLERPLILPDLYRDALSLAQFRHR